MLWQTCVASAANDFPRGKAGEIPTYLYIYIDLWGWWCLRYVDVIFYSFRCTSWKRGRWNEWEIVVEVGQGIKNLFNGIELIQPVTLPWRRTWDETTLKHHAPRNLHDDSSQITLQNLPPSSEMNENQNTQRTLEI